MSSLFDELGCANLWVSQLCFFVVSYSVCLEVSCVRMEISSIHSLLKDGALTPEFSRVLLVCALSGTQLFLKFLCVCM